MKNNYLNLKLFLTIILLIFFILTLFPLIQLDFYAHPSDDDNYKVFTAIKSVSQLKRIIKLFFNQGLSYRYSSSIIAIPILTKIPLQITESVINTLIIKYRILALTQIICFILSIFYLCYSFNKHITKQSKLFLFFLFTLLYYILLSSSTYIFHTFYEMVSASGYSTGLWLSFLLIGLLIDNYHTDKKYIPIAIVIFFICGTLEVFSIITGSILLYFFLLKIIKSKKVDYIFILFGIFVITVFILNFLNPGKQVKLRDYGSSDWVIGKGESRLSFKQIMHYLKDFIIVCYLSVKTLLRKRNIIFTAMLTTIVSILLIKKNKIINIFSILPFYIVIAIGGFAFHYSYLSILSLQRANNLLSILISFLNIIFLTVLEELVIYYTLPVWKSLNSLIKAFSTKKEIVTFNNEIKNYFVNNKKPVFIISTVFCIFVLLFLVIKPGNKIADCYSAILTGSAKRYDQELMLRYKTIINSKDPVVYVPKLTNPPQVLFYMDTLEAGSWATFFDKEKLLYTENTQTK